MLKFDLYRKLPQELVEQSRSGVIISLCSLLVMVYLIVIEYMEFKTLNIETQMFVDQINDDLIINIDISLPRMPCDLISIDQQDVMGSEEINLKGEVVRTRIKQNVSLEILTSNEEPNLQRARQAFKDGEGCDIKGYIILNRVPGNFHISSHPYGMQLQDILPYAGLSTFDLSHHIKHLSFGEQKDLHQIRQRFKQGILNPLDGISRMKNKELKHVGVTHQYYISIVPTKYIDMDNSVYKVNQFTVNTNEAQTHQMPAIYFRYDISPVTVQFSKYYETLWHFLVQLCAILGGVISIAGLIDQIIYTYSSPIVILK
ncbi:Endoplasmic reticulum-Golgi intermediate compartment protein 2 [Paramecium bursaria]